ncbi:MAG TPA: hypothetical protein VF988_11925 [Verrucomicrobiae bacterium]
MSLPPDGCESAWTNGPETIGVYHLGLDKNLRDRLDDLNAVRDYYRTIFAKDGIGLIECNLIEIEGVRAAQAIGKIILPQEGAAYAGTVAVPMPRESYVFNTLAREIGVTGLRETIVMLKLSKDLETQGYVLHTPVAEPPGSSREAAPHPIFWKNAATGEIQRWCQDPYDPDYNGPCLRNLADAPEFDEKLPDHPLSRVRATLRELVQDLRFSPSLKNRSQPKGGWRFW